MKQSNLFGIIRAILSVAGAFLLGKNLFGQPIDESLWQEITGVIMGLIAMVWTFMDKTITLEGFQGILRQSITFIGGLLVASGKLSAEALATWLGIILALAGPIYAWLSKTKSKQLENGKIMMANLKK